MSKNKQTELDEKVQRLEARNAQLEKEISIFTSRFSSTSEQAADDEIDLSELWRVIWRGKWIIVIATCVFTILSIFYAYSLPNQYKVTAILAPASSSSSLSRLPGQLSGLASLAGINLGGSGGEDKSVVAMEIIKTWGFLEKFIQDHGIQVEVFAAKGWDRAKNELIIDSSLYNKKNKKWVRAFNEKKGQTAAPNSWELYESFKNRVSISKNEKNGLISLSVEYYSPFLAKKWADQLIVSINKHIQMQDKTEAEKSIQYLEKKIYETKIADMKNTFYKLIEEQRKNLMLAEVSDEYILKTLSEAKVAMTSSNPKRSLIIILATFFGGMLR